MIRVLRLIARLNIGGPALHVTNLARGLNPARYETMLVSGQVGRSEGNMADLANGLNFHVIPELGREVSPPADALTLIKLLSLMRRFRPHIVHTHTAKAGAVGRIAARLAGVPLVVHTFHGHTFQGYWTGRQSQAVVLAERGFARLANKLVAVSERVRNDLIALRIAAPERIVTIPLGLDLAPFAETRRPRPEAPPVVGIIGRLVPVKNHPLFIEAARLLVRDGFSGRFMIVGDGELRGELERLAADLGDRITFTGWRRDLAKVYSELAVVVNTSRNEGTPVALIEAMAAGVPVAATAVGGVPDVVRDGAERTGWLAPSNDAAALAGVIRQALIDDGSVAARARADVLKRFAKDRLISDVEALYESLMQNSRFAIPNPPD